MAGPPKPFSRQDLEKDSFATDDNGDTCRRVCVTETVVTSDPSENPDTGDTIHENGTVGLTAISIPATAGGTITSFLFEVPEQGDTTIEVSISLDGGTKFKALNESSSWSWSPRGALKQLKIKANKAGVSFESVLNRNP